jgi:hypothetical protein
MLVMNIITIIQGKIFNSQCYIKYRPLSAVNTGMKHISCAVIDDDISHKLTRSSSRGRINNCDNSMEQIVCNKHILLNANKIDRYKRAEIKGRPNNCDIYSNKRQKVKRLTALYCAEGMIQEEDTVMTDVKTPTETSDDIDNKNEDKVKEDDVNEEFRYDDYYVEPVNNLQENPINLFHSVVCGSYGTIPEGLYEYLYVCECVCLYTYKYECIHICIYKYTYI